MLPKLFSKHWFATGTVILVLSFGSFLRLYRFEEFPYGINNDGALVGLIALDLWHKLPHYTPYYMAWVGETLFPYLHGLMFAVFGVSPTILRLAPVLISVATLPVFYLCSKRLLGRLPAVAALLFLSLSSWHLTISKTAVFEVLVPLFQTIAMYLLLRAFRFNTTRAWLWAGIGLAVVLNTYGAARITPLIFGVSGLAWFVQYRPSLKVTVKHIIFFVLAFVIAFSPMLNFALHDRETFVGRANFLYIGNRPDWWQALKINFFETLGFWHVQASHDEFFGADPVLEKIPGFLFVVGIVYALFRFRRFPYQIILIWLSLGVLPGLISIPNGNHNISVLPPTFMLVGLGCHVLFRLVSRFNVFLAAFVLIGLFSLTAWQTYRFYFSPEKKDFYGFYPETLIVADFIRQNLNKYNFYLTDNYPRDAITFTTYTTGDPWAKKYTWVEKNTDLLSVEHSDKRGLMFFMFPIAQNQPIADGLLRKFPTSYKLEIPYQNGAITRIASLVIVVPPR